MCLFEENKRHVSHPGKFMINQLPTTVFQIARSAFQRLSSVFSLLH
jgi:hypothetical protein